MSDPLCFGPYQVLRALGQGGMGRVFEVAHPGLPGRRLALKQLLVEQATPDATPRFLREARLLARVEHPCVVKIHELVEQSPEGPFMVMDLVEGSSLGAHHKAGPLDPRQAAELVAALADALAAAHAAGVLHRDLKPDNVILRPDGTPVLLDFGLARARDQERLTQSGSLLGTPNYMAPEQAEGLSPDKLDERVDVYGLGAVLYALLTGRHPHQEAQSLIALLNRVMNLPFTWPDAEALGGHAIPPGLVAITRRATALRPEDRYPSARALGAALRDWLAGPAPAPRSRRGLLVLGGLAGAALLLAAGALAVRARGASEPGPDLPAGVETRRALRPPPSGPAAPQPVAPALRAWQRLEHPGAPRRVGAGFYAGGRRFLSWPLEGSGPAAEHELVEWRLEPPAPPEPTGRRWSLRGPVAALALASSGRAVFWCAEAMSALDLQAPDAQPLPLRFEPPLRPEPFTALAISPDGARLALAHAAGGEPPGPRVVVYDLAGGQARALPVPVAPRDPGIGVLLLDARRLVMAGTGEVLRGANQIEEVPIPPATGDPIRITSGYGHSALAFDPQGGLWSGNTNWAIHPLQDGTLGPGLVGVAAHAQTGGAVGRTPSHNGQVNQLRFAPADWGLPGPRWLVSACSHPAPLDRADVRDHPPWELRVWSPDPRGEWGNVAGLSWSRVIDAMDLTPDGQWVLVAAGGALELLSRPAVPALRGDEPRLPAHEEVVRRLAAEPAPERQD